MNRELAHKVADAVLYEGYSLYPYRPSALKNRQRWTFGILYPPGYAEVLSGTERAQMHTECLVQTEDSASIRVDLRFLHLMSRQVLSGADGGFKPVPSATVDGRLVESWDEGAARSLTYELTIGARQQSFEFDYPASRTTEPLKDSAGNTVGAVDRIQQELRGTVSVSSELLREKVWKLTIDVTNTSASPVKSADRNAILLSSLLSAHTILEVNSGEFITLLDPPAEIRELAASCHNVGNFPVLVGNAGERDMLLCSPILLYDYPQIAPESAGDFFDATEMDEMLTLRVMTLSDEEKNQIRMADDHVRNLLQRTEESAREQLMRTHGVIRSLRPVNDQ